MKNAIKKFWDSEDGMGVVEVVLITIVLVEACCHYGSLQFGCGVVPR